MLLEDFPPEAQHAYYRKMAYVLAVAHRTLESPDAQYQQTGPVRGRVILTDRGVIAVSPTDVNAVGIERDLKGVRFDSTCTLWTCELGRFRRTTSAQALARKHPPKPVAGFNEFGDLEFHDLDPNVVVFYESCVGAWEPGSFVARLDGDTPWSVRRGLFYSREDADFYARVWTRETRWKVRVVSQRVDGPVLEQAFREPEE